MPASVNQPLGNPPQTRQLSDRWSPDAIPVEVLLEIDALYLQGAAADTLTKIAPKRFNRLGLAWLPILQIQRSGFDFTARFSNTLQANRLGKTSDWVIIDYRKKGRCVGRETIVTEFRGAASGSRVVRGRETECYDIGNKSVLFDQAS